MKGPRRKVIAAIVAASLAVAIVPAVVVASIITNATAVAVKVTAKLKTTSEAVLTGTTGPLAGLVTTCTASGTNFDLTTKGGGLGPFTITPPTFTGCSDNLGGTDTIKSTGAWTTTYVNGTSKTNPDMIKLGIPKAGQTLVSSIAPACTVTVDPAAAGSVSGNYDNVGNLSFTSQPLNYSAAGTCPTGTGSGVADFSTVLKSSGSGTGTYTVTPPIFGIH